MRIAMEKDEPLLGYWQTRVVQLEAACKNTQARTRYWKRNFWFAVAGWVVLAVVGTIAVLSK